jgi:hypothetical protein
MKANMSVSGNKDQIPSRDENGPYEPGITTDEKPKYAIGKSKATFLQMSVAFMNPLKGIQDPLLNVSSLQSPSSTERSHKHAPAAF